MLEIEVVSSRLFLVYSIAFATQSLNYRVRHTFGETSEVTGIDFNRLNKFVIISKSSVALR